MSPEEAMEQYISLLSENIPDWMVENPYVSISKNTIRLLTLF